jgi:phosphatidylglycerophosphatase A
MKILILLIATVGGAGYFPLASGTLASGLAVLPYFLLRGHTGLYIGITIALFAIGVWSSRQAEQLLKQTDPHAVVIDEVTGYLIAVACLPHHWFYPLAAFFLFRLFDIWKPFPINRSQNLPGGWGIMVDDVLAGIYTNLILQAGRYFLPF